FNPNTNPMMGNPNNFNPNTNPMMSNPGSGNFNGVNPFSNATNSFPLNGVYNVPGIPIRNEFQNSSTPIDPNFDTFSYSYDLSTTDTDRDPLKTPHEISSSEYIPHSTSSNENYQIPSIQHTVATSQTDSSTTRESDVLFYSPTPSPVNSQSKSNDPAVEKQLSDYSKKLTNMNNRLRNIEVHLNMRPKQQ
ncbi:MAG: hypothetical protein ACRCST_14715, partial [Turicibacter sp.]